MSVPVRAERGRGVGEAVRGGDKDPWADEGSGADDDTVVLQADVRMRCVRPASDDRARRLGESQQRSQESAEDGEQHEVAAHVSNPSSQRDSLLQSESTLDDQGPGRSRDEQTLDPPRALLNEQPLACRPRRKYCLGMPKSRVTRRQLLVAAAPAVAAAPLAKLALGEASAANPEKPLHGGMAMGAMGHAAMIGSEVPAPGGPDDLTHLLHPPKPLAQKPGRVREYTLVAEDRQLEVAKGVFFSAWTYNGTSPGPVIRATEGDLLRVTLANAGSHAHTIHFHGTHPANMDGVFEIV